MLSAMWPPLRALAPLPGSKTTSCQIERWSGYYPISQLNRSPAATSRRLQATPKSWRPSSGCGKPCRSPRTTSSSSIGDSPASQWERHAASRRIQEAVDSVAAIDEQGRQIGIVFKTASPFDTPRLMTELIGWFNQAREDEHFHPLLLIAVFTVIFPEIHPFQDGNGRLSRVLTTLLLLQAGYGYVPYSSLKASSRTARKPTTLRYGRPRQRSVSLRRTGSRGSSSFYVPWSSRSDGSPPRSSARS